MMLEGPIKTLVSRLNGILLLVALTGFACTYSKQSEDDCQSTTSRIWCFECDSRYDPNCGEPFDFTTDYALQQRPQSNASHAIQTGPTQRELSRLESHNDINFQIPSSSSPKKYPAVAICQGCCVKITTRTPDGVSLVKRTCTANLQINFFMVDLVCMRESGNGGKMCFCETDYCNGQTSRFRFKEDSLSLLILVVLISVFMATHRH